MGYRDSFLNNKGLSVWHNEAALFGYDRELVAKDPAEVLVVGVGNGGMLRMLKESLPDGSVVGGLDEDVRCAELGLPVKIGPVGDAEWVKRTLPGCWFDFIIDRSGSGVPHLWPYLKTGGRLLVECPGDGLAQELLGEFPYGDGWLPGEEVLRISVYPDLLAVEKRTPRVVPYVTVITGDEFPVIPVDDLLAGGMKRLTTDP